MTPNFSATTAAQNAMTVATTTKTSGDWRIEAQNTLSTVDRLDEAFHTKVADLNNMKRDNPKAKLIRQQQTLRKAGRDLRLARTSFQEQMHIQAKTLCRPFCEAVYERLPQELRDMIVRHLITENSATFLTGKDDKISFANGTSTLKHVFEEEYTGIGLHTDILRELITQNARFDFRARHELLGKVFKHYAADEHGNLDLPSQIRRLSLVLIERHLKNREVVLAHLEQLSGLRQGTNIYIIIETGYSSQAQAIRQVRHVLRLIIALLERLHKLGLHVHVVVNPAWSASNVTNASNDNFSIANEETWRYEMTPENAVFTVQGFEQRLRDLFKKYDDLWNSRDPPQPW